MSIPCDSTTIALVGESLITAIFVLIIELVNSAIENVVDLVTKEIHPLAKSAKDIGSTAVMFSIILHVALWILFLIK